MLILSFVRLAVLTVTIAIDITQTQSGTACNNRYWYCIRLCRVLLCCCESTYLERVNDVRDEMISYIGHFAVGTS